MKYGKVQGVDKPVSRLVLGTMIINANEQPRSSELLDAAFELGCTTFDTAHVYGGGNSERGLGVWMRERGNREKVVILSKGAIPNGDARGSRSAGASPPSPCRPGPSSTRATRSG